MDINKPYISDINMIKAINMLKESGEIPFKLVAYEVMNVDTSWVNRISKQEKYKRGVHFTAEHIRLFCDYFNINSNYIFGLETDMYRK